MSQEYLSLAVWEPLPGMETASLATMRELNAVVLKNNYGRDQLFRCGDSCYLLLRIWNSEQARATAQEDPEVLRCWARLGNEIQILKVYEKLEDVGV
jgi:hypothetical protein